jgi:hypothetical protein
MQECLNQLRLKNKFANDKSVRSALRSANRKKRIASGGKRLRTLPPTFSPEDQHRLEPFARSQSKPTAVTAKCSGPAPRAWQWAKKS